MGLNLFALRMILGNFHTIKVLLRIIFMTLLRKYFNLFISFPVTITLLATFAFLIGYATFLENDYSTTTAKALVYANTYFEVLLMLLVINLIGSIIKYKMYKFKKIIIFTFHISFVVIALGALVTRYIGYEGVMSIKEGASTNYMLSSDTYLNISLKHDNTKTYFEKKVIFSEVYKFVNYFNDKVKIKDNVVYVEYKDFIPNSNVFFKKDNANKDIILNFALSINGNPHDVYLKNGESIVLNSGQIVSFNNHNKDTENSNSFINFVYIDNNVFIKSKKDFKQLDMATEKSIDLPQGALHLFENRKLFQSGGVNIVLKSINKKSKMIYQSRHRKDDIPDAVILNISLNGESREITIFGDNGELGLSKAIKIGDVLISINYGSIITKLPFSIKLNDFILDRYAGSNSPSSYKSIVTLKDDRFNINKKQEVFMNNILSHDGYRFYQSSYFPDESGTILSVNKDYSGTIITYIGYFLLTIGLLMSLVSPNGRVAKLRGKLEGMKSALAILIAIVPMYTFSAEDKKIDTADLLQKIKSIDYDHAKKMGQLQVQDFEGRIKPLNTVSNQVLRKVYRKSSIFSMSADQVFLSMLIMPDLWQNVKMIMVKDKRIKEILGVSKTDKYVSFKEFFDYSKKDVYKLASYSEASHQKKPANRTTFDKDIIKIDEKVNILYMVYAGSFLKVFPNPSDADDDTWYAPSDAVTKFPLKDGNFIRNILSTYFMAVESANIDGNYSKADKVLDLIKIFQSKTTTLQKSENEIDLEIFYNEINIFDKLSLFYLFLAFSFIILSILSIYKPNQKLEKYLSYARIVLFAGFIVHFLALALRWEISGHAPWSNGYESMIYISFTMILAGYILARKSFIILSATTLIASITLLVAHLSWMDPEITNLVPVLKSYWLTIHVSIITASYGFFAISAMIGIFYMLIILFSDGKHNNHLEEMGYINEMSIYIGLIFITIGNFLGGIWANESWGRYWGWDAKETWALVSILFYAIIVHFRFIPLLKGYFIFHMASILAFFSILMTYFGVNFYLAGLHSYAKGDPIPVPSWVYYAVSFVFLLIISAFIKNKYINSKIAK